jgi:hypothetical protein
VRVEFNVERLTSEAGVLIAAALSDRLGLEEVVNDRCGLLTRVPCGAPPGRKVTSLARGMLVGADSIDDMNVWRAGSTELVSGAKGVGSLDARDVVGCVYLCTRLPSWVSRLAWACEAGAGPAECRW